MDRQTVLASLLRRLNTVSGLDPDDIEGLRSLPIAVRHWEGGRVIVSDGERPKEATRNFSWQDLDITCKVLEGAREPAEVTLFLQMRRLFAEARAESEILNKPR